MESYVECWKLFNQYLNMARNKKFSQEDEAEFLELKSIITQELEMIMAAIECSSPSRDDVHSLISSATSIRFLSELNEASRRNLENQWHKIYIGWQSILGQLKVKVQTNGTPSRWEGLFSRRSE